MKISIYQIDAFAASVFSGNPAAVCPLTSWPEESLLQEIAAENNLSETSFFVPEKEAYRIRWFTPKTEVDLCGHGTLAAAWVVFRYFEPSAEKAVFLSRSGPLAVGREEERIVLDLPARPLSPCPPPEELVAGLDCEPLEVLCGEDCLAVLPTEEDVAKLSPDLAALGKLDRRAVIVTARGRDADFVSRCFAPRLGIDEDPVTGSAHCSLVPYWSKVLGKTELRALQLSKRGGELFCRDRGERVHIAGRAVPYLEGMITI